MCEQCLRVTDTNVDFHLDSSEINRTTVLVALDTIYTINHCSLACLGGKCDHWWAIRKQFCGDLGFMVQASGTEKQLIF